jgi:hypothetical protein
MVTKTTQIIGMLTLVIMLTGAIYISFNQEVKIRVDNDQTTFYVYSEVMHRWLISAVEGDSLLNGTRTVLRDAQNVKTTVTVNEPNVSLVRETPYQKGPKIVDFYGFSGDIFSKEDFPIYRTVEIYNGTGLIYQYELRNLNYSGPTQEVNGTTLLFGYSMKVELDPSYYWAKVYESGILKVRYRIKSDYVILHIRLFDPYTSSVSAITGALENISVRNATTGRYCTFLKLNTSSYTNRPYSVKLGIVGNQNTTSGAGDANITIRRVIGNWVGGNTTKEYASYLTSLSTSGEINRTFSKSAMYTEQNISITEIVQSCWDNSETNCTIRIEGQGCGCNTTDSDGSTVLFLGTTTCNLSRFGFVGTENSTKYWRFYSDFDTSIDLYINGSKANKSVELGQAMNLSANSTGNIVCISITGIGVVNCSADVASYLWTPTPNEWKFSDQTTSKNFTAYTNFNITMLKPLDFINGSLGLWGWNTSSHYPGNVSFWYNNSLWIWLPDNLTFNQYFTNHLTNGLESQNITASPTTSNVSYVTISTPINYTTVKFNVSSYQNVTIQDAEIAGSGYCEIVQDYGIGNCANGFDENMSTYSMVDLNYYNYPSASKGYDYENFLVDVTAPVDIWYYGYFYIDAVANFGVNMYSTVNVTAYNYTDGTWHEIGTVYWKCMVPGVGCVDNAREIHALIDDAYFNDYVVNDILRLRIHLAPAGFPSLPTYDTTYHHLLYMDSKINFTAYPDAYIDATDDSDWDYNTTSLVAPVTVTINASEVNSYACGANVTCQYPIEIATTAGGLFNISAINFTASTDDIMLNKTLLSNTITASTPATGKSNVTFSVNMSNGTLQVWDVNFSYYGHQNYTVTANITGATDSRLVSVYWSNLSRKLPYTWTTYILWYPDTNSSKNVTPWGQSSTVPLYNITTFGYWNNMSIRVYNTSAIDPCLNISFSNSSSFTNPVKLNGSAQNIITNKGWNENIGIFVKEDLDNCAYPFSTGNWSLQGWCAACG